MNIQDFISKYSDFQFWFVSYKDYYFKLKSVTTEFDEIYILTGGITNLSDLVIEFNKEYHLDRFNILCAMIKKKSGEVIHIDNVVDAVDYLI